MSEPKLMALLRVSPEAIRDLFQLPPGTEVLRVETRPEYRGSVDIVIAGAGWPTDEGGPIRTATGVVQREFLTDGCELIQRIEWGFPV